MDDKSTPSDFSKLLGPDAEAAALELGETIDYLLGRMAGRYRLGPEDFEDLRQEVLAICLKKAQKISCGQTRALENRNAWLCRVSHNAVLGLYRQRAGHPQDVAGWPEGFNPPAPKQLDLEEKLTLRRALSFLDHGCRKLLILREVLQESRKAIARILATSSNAVGARLFRCRRKLLELYMGKKSWSEK